MTGWGLVGASNIARQYMINAIRQQPGNTVLAVNSSSADRANAYAAEMDIASGTDDLSRMLADPAIDAVYISTTNELHYSQAMAAINAGKHVLCEKPLALYTDDARAMVNAAEKAGVVFGTNHHLRNAGLHRRIREFVAGGDLGDIVAVRVFHAVFLPVFLQGWRVSGVDAGGGVVLDITVHDADTVRFVLDDDPVEVTAFTASQGMASTGLADGVMGVLRMQSGALVQFHDAYTVEHVQTGFEVIGTRAAAIGRNCMTQNPVGELILRTGTHERVVDDFERGDLYTRSVANFCAAMNGTGSVSATGEDGLWSLATALAVQESADTGHAVSVRLD
jgi:1,5-anhydro-D-fructose reductase (1,5-anhydro-D-mannitol-forming)